MNPIARRRLANQFLSAPTLRSAPDVVRSLGAVQAQDYAGAKWALAQRSRGLTDGAIERAFARGAILRTHVLRPTWHFVLPEDARWMLELTAPRIRASQGHSVEVDLQYETQTPPELLYHGTAIRFLDAIRQNGLQKMARHDVHLSAETKMTLQVGGRHGKPVLLTIRAGDMHRAGHVFRRSANGVWLVEHVPAKYIKFSS